MVVQSTELDIERGQLTMYDSRYASDTMLAPYLPADADPATLASHVHALLAHQRRNCDAIRVGYEALEHISVREERLGTSHIIVQYNPARERNTKDLSMAAAKQRQCFLDAGSMVPGERGIPYDNLLICGNPFPILRDHLTILWQEHINQSISPLLDPAYDLAAQLENSHAIFYNGPEVGASAPDHAHLQAGAKYAIPILRDMHTERHDALYATANTRIFVLPDLGRTAIVIQGSDMYESTHLVKSIMRKLPQPESGSEPLVNILFTYDAGSWTTVLFPRRQFRPSFFAADSPQQMLISPAALEMGGIIVTPRRHDFDHLTVHDISTMYQEVSLPMDETRAVVSSL